MKRKVILSTMLFLASTMMVGQTSSSQKAPLGASYSLTDGTTVTKNGETLSSSTQYYNVVQVTNGTLNLNNCTISKTGDGMSGDNSSFYGTNSTVYAGDGTGSSSTTSAKNAKINMTGGTITTSSQGANAIFATNGATITADGVTIDNSQTVSRGMHATFGGIINATNMNITTRKATSSTVATDRGGGTVTISESTLTAKGDKSAVLYSTGTITATSVTGLSEQGPIATVEGTNYAYIINSNMTSGSEKRGLFLQQSGSGDAEGKQPVCSVTSSTLTMTNSTAPLIYIKNVTGSVELTDVTLSIASGKLMVVPESDGSTGTLALRTTQDSWTYTGTVDAGTSTKAVVTVGANVTWEGAVDSDNDAQSTSVTIESGAVWNLTGNSYVTTLVNYGTINRNGYTLTATSTSGSGTINETSGISEAVSRQEADSKCYDLTGRRVNVTTKGLVIRNGKKIINQ